ncbi:MAG TPA: hypothetical protein VND67_07695 [Acidimicrobiales bacterium]|nr:hypothetical protein [Acidimicrobiales bacterium]
MTVVDPPVEKPKVGEAELLFQEARQRRRRRWLVSGIVASVVLALLGFILSVTLTGGGRGPLPQGATPLTARPAAAWGGTFSIRPVLCYAPPLTLAAGQAPAAGTLPTCSASSELTATNLGVEPDSNNVNGYTWNSSIPVDPQFATYPSTSPANDNLGSTVLLPAASTNQGAGRYVLGPARITRSAIKSASAQLVNNQWSVSIAFTGEGATQWDTLAQQQFHAIIGIDVGGKVVSAPITEPSQTSFSSLNGRLEISGSFSQQQAKALAAQL